jgi:eukaryotic-like serine/threonine-protein kinase
VAPHAAKWEIRPALAAPDDYIGKTVAAKYRVEQMIGEGGMGKVYKATQLALDKPVVLKVLRQALLSDERTVARFQREAKAASRLNHPNSISVLDFGQSEDGALYIAMEYVQGKDLHHIVSREWPLPESRIIRIISQVLSALADAHSASVIHRDLKPENIMVEQRRGEPDFVKVLDFGIAKIVDGTDDDGPALTRAGFVCGTPEYMSPEQARGATLDPRSDLYSVGVILYQLVAGLLPFDSDTAVGFATAHLTEQPPPPSRRRPDARVSPSMERLIMRALAKSPDDRPQTADQFRAELLAIEKERRAQVSVVRRGVSAPSLAPVSRPGTPLDEEETRVKNPQPHRASPWSVPEVTVKATKEPPGPVPAPPGESAPTTKPDRVGERGAVLIFKVATVLLVVLALGLGGMYVWQLVGQHKPVFAPAPQPGGQPLWALEVAPEDRRLAESARLAEKGDDAVFDANLQLAEARYEQAWKADPTPELALKLGEMAYQQNHLEEASRWWQRFRNDAPGSIAKAYLDQLPLKTGEGN